jgi:type IV secretory pathway TrbD component
MAYVWLRPALFIGLPGAVLVLSGVVLAVAGAELLGWMRAAAGIVTLAVAYALRICATSILAVALFRYAEGRPPSAGFTPEQLERVLRGPSP